MLPFKSMIQSSASSNLLFFLLVYSLFQLFYLFLTFFLVSMFHFMLTVSLLEFSLSLLSIHKKYFELLSGKLLASISVSSFSGVLFYSFIWDMLPCLLILAASL